MVGGSEKASGVAGAGRRAAVTGSGALRSSMSSCRHAGRGTRRLGACVLPGAFAQAVADAGTLA